MSGEKKGSELKLPPSLNRLGLLRRSGGNSPGSMRLPSLKPARDLTLGGVPKRTFTPNIPVRRAREEFDTSQEEPQPGPSGERDSRHDGRLERGRGRERGRSRGRGEIIASQSVFSQGPFALQKRVGDFISGGSVSRPKDISEPTSRSSFIRAEKGQIEQGEDSKRVLEMLMDSGKMELDDDELKEGSLMPITIPLANPKLLSKQAEEAVEHASPLKGIKVKLEPEDVEMADVKPKPLPFKSPKRRTIYDNDQIPQITCSQLFCSNFQEEKLLFFQFPDALPIKPLSHDNIELKLEEERNVTTKNNKENPADREEELSKFCFKNVSEGYVGKLQVHKSGRVRLILGNVALDVTMGTPCGFLQDLVAVHVNEDRRDMVCLGHVNNRVICVPDYEELIGSAG